MVFPADSDVLLDPSQVTGSCEVVRRYLVDALFAGDERALIETVSDPELTERAWLFWAAFPQRGLDGIDVLFADASGTHVACHYTATMVQDGPWITSAPRGDSRTVVVECTGIYMVTGGRIVNYRETWR